jgi:hypothetical protein
MMKRVSFSFINVEEPKKSLRKYSYRYKSTALPPRQPVQHSVDSQLNMITNIKVFPIYKTDDANSANFN